MKDIIYNSIQKYKDLLFFIPFVIFVNSTIISLRTDFFRSYSYILSLIRYTCLLIVVTKILICDIKNYSISTIIRITLILLLTIIVKFVTDDSSFFQLFILIIGSYDIEFKKIVKWTLISEIILFLIIVCACILKIIPNYVYSRKGSTIKRYSLGFKYSTSPSIFIFYFTMLYIYLRDKKIKKIEYIMLLIPNILIYYLTDSRTGFFCTVLLMLLSFIYNLKNEKINNIFVFLSKYIFYFFAVVSIILMVLYHFSTEKFIKLNDILSGRLQLTENAINEYGIKPFGNKIEWVGLCDVNVSNKGKNISEFNMIDNSYLNLLIVYGVIPFILVLFLYSNIANYIKKTKNEYLSIFLLVIAINAFIDPILIRLMNNVFMLLFCYTFISKKQRRTFYGNKNDYLSLKQIQDEEKDMLRKIDKFCTENEIEYSICGGTLLGAIRHKGFIPWDDDIDIIMTRENYYKLEEIVHKKGNKIDDLYVASFEFNNLYEPFIKVFNHNIQVENIYYQDDYEKYLWIDIFPMDGLPEDVNKRRKLFKKSLVLRKILSIIRVSDDSILNETKDKRTIPLKIFLRLFLENDSGIRFICQKIKKISTKYDCNDSKYVGGLTWGYGPQEALLREELLPYIKLDFEDIKVSSFSCWDKYLRNLYNDYMTLPPEEKRIVHGIKAKYIK